MPITSGSKTNLQREHSADRRVWAIAGPVIIANSSAPLVGLVDTWAIGHLPDAAQLAAVGVGATVFSYVFWAFGFLRMSTTGLVAQAHGTQDDSGVLEIIIRSLAFAITVAVLLIIAQVPILSTSLIALAPPEDVATHYSDYFSIRIWSAPAILVTYGVMGYLIGVARAKTALVVQLVLNISNAGLNLVFVLGFNMGVEGIAFGSLVAEWLAALLGACLIVHHYSTRRTLDAIKTRAIWTFKGFAHIASTNGFIFVRTLLLLTALALVTRQAGGISEAALAASHIMNVFMLLISLGLDGFAYAAEALAGAAFGKGSIDTFKKWVRVTSKWAVIAAIAYTALFLFAGEMVIKTLTDVADVRAEAMTALPAIILLPLLSVACYQFDGIFIGATTARAMMVTMALSTAVFLAVLTPLTDAYGLLGLWLAVVIFSAMRGLTQAIYYPRILRKFKGVED